MNIIGSGARAALVLVLVAAAAASAGCVVDRCTGLTVEECDAVREREATEKQEREAARAEMWNNTMDQAARDAGAAGPYALAATVVIPLWALALGWASDWSTRPLRWVPPPFGRGRTIDLVETNLAGLAGYFAFSAFGGGLVLVGLVFAFTKIAAWLTSQTVTEVVDRIMDRLAAIPPTVMDDTTGGRDQ